MRPFLLVIVIGILILSLPTGVASQEQVEITDDVLLDPITITTTIFMNDTTIFTVNARINNLSNTSLSSVDIRVDSKDIEIKSAKYNGIDTTTDVALMERHSMVTVHFLENVDTNQSVWIFLKIQSTDIQGPIETGIDGQSLHGSLVYYVRPHHTFANFTFITILPGHVSLSHESLVPIFPEANSNFTDGESMAFVWNIPILQPGQEHVFIVRYQLHYPNLIQNNLLLPEAWIFIIFGILCGVILGVTGPNLIRRAKSISSTQYAGLTSEEEEILVIIQQRGGSCPQKELYRQLTMSESKLSLVLGNLEERRLIRRFREGRENMIHIVDNDEQVLSD